MLSLITKIKSYLPIIFFLLIISSVVVFKFCLTIVEKERDAALEQRNAEILKNTELQADINKQNEAVNQLKAAYLQQVENVKNADKLSQEKQAFYANEANKYLNAKIDNTCMGAIQWGALQGPVLYAQWFAQ